MNVQKINELLKAYNKNQKHELSLDDFVMNAKRYIAACKQGRLMCSIDSVSASGMSRTLKFVEMNGNKKNGFYVYNFWVLFKILGFQEVKHSDYFRVHGCGMDMVFHTNYSIIHDLHHIGLISKKDCLNLAQKTPHKI